MQDKNHWRVGRHIGGPIHLVGSFHAFVDKRVVISNTHPNNFLWLTSTALYCKQREQNHHGHFHRRNHASQGRARFWTAAHRRSNRFCGIRRALLEGLTQFFGFCRFQGADVSRQPARQSFVRSGGRQRQHFVSATVSGTRNPSLAAEREDVSDPHNLVCRIGLSNRKCVGRVGH